MNYLQLCRRVAQDSGTFPAAPAVPLTTVGQTGREARVVGWVRDAYREIQTEKREWRWLEADFTSATILGVRDYTPAALGITDRFRRWIAADGDGLSRFSLFAPAEGQDTEGRLRQLTWERFRSMALFGPEANRQGKPVYFAVDPQNRVRLHPIPDAAYTLRGSYRRGPQELLADDDVPEMPEEFHMAIVYRALILLGVFDEAFDQVQSWQALYASIEDQLMTDQTPPVTTYGAFA